MLVARQKIKTLNILQRCKVKQSSRVERKHSAVVFGSSLSSEPCHLRKLVHAITNVSVYTSFISIEIAFLKFMLAKKHSIMSVSNI